MKYGYFDDKDRTYVITDPRTPVKWINYIGTLNFGGFVDNTGGALICKGDPALNRITKYIPQIPAGDFRGEGLFLRFKQGDEYEVFSPFFSPTLDPFQYYECHVGLGYTRILSEFYGIRAEVIIFVPNREDCEIRDINVTNISNVPLEMDAIPVVEYTHPDALKQFTNADWVPQTMVSKAVRGAEDSLILVQYPFMYRDLRVNYFTSSMPTSSFDSDRKVFLGDNEYCGWSSPMSLQQEELNDSQALRGDNIAALMIHLGKLQPGETRRLVTLLGQAPSLEAAEPTIQKFRQPREVENAFTDLAYFWTDYLIKMQVVTPEVSMDQMLNVHNPRQCYVTKNWSRYLSLYQLGFGARGIGFRDSSQDVMGVIGNIPDEALDLIRMLLRVQRCNGSAMHQFNPLTMVANEGDSREVEGSPNYYSDDHLWIILAVTAYLKETGDLAFLEEEIPYYEKDKAGQPIEAGTVRDHLQRALEFTHNDVGTHGLPLAGFADWNDATNLRIGAESVFVANLFGWALREIIELFDYLGDEDAVDRYQMYYAEMRDCVNEHCWDGEWYIRYFDFDGTPIGSAANDYGQLFANAQSWSVLSGFASPERARSALDAIYERLNTKHGIKLFTPGFDGFDPDLGGVSTYPPGTKENGGIFLHANPWAIIAETMVGNGDRAFEYYNQINPAEKINNIDVFESEPYVYPQNILGDEHPQFGLARNSWLTGTASWVYQAATKYILGIRPAYDGLIVDPCIPRQWDRFIVIRHFRGTVYHISVKNPVHVNRGVWRVIIDGVESSDGVLPVSDKLFHDVVVIMGEDE